MEAVDCDDRNGPSVTHVPGTKCHLCDRTCRTRLWAFGHQTFQLEAFIGHARGSGPVDCRSLLMPQVD
jgi:hypothetical protein